MSQADRIALNLAEQLHELRKDIILERTSQLVDSTPIDTMYARSNWIPTVGDGPSGPVGTPDNVGAAQSAQQVGIAAVMASRDAEAEMNVTNHVDYVEQLNKGSSPQAEANFVEHAIERADAIVMARWQAKQVEL